MSGRHRRGFRVGEWGVIPIALGLVILPQPGFDRLPPPIAVEVNGSVRLLAPGSTLGRTLDAFGLRPEAGDLLDIDGIVLAEDRFPASLTVNGLQAGDGLVLEDGDRVDAVPGATATEGIARKVVGIPPGQIANPQAFLGSQPGEQIIVTGRRSGKILSSVFRPTGEAERPMQVALTFDDGPNETWTPRILRILRRKRAPATFFVVGSLAARHPELVARAKADGHTIANHTMNHPFRKPFAKAKRGLIVEEIRRGTAALAEAGVTASLFRPPGGSWSPRVVELAREVDQRVVLWSVDSRDWAGRTAREIVQGVLREVEPGAIVLLHDGGGSRAATVAALPRLINGLRRAGLEPVAL